MMPPMENQPSNGKKALLAMELELIRGSDVAYQLLEVFVDKSNIHLGDKEKSILPFAEDLVRKVLKSFTNSLLLLNTKNDDHGEVVVPVTIRDFSTPANCPKPEDMDETCKSLTTGNRRGCYKRNWKFCKRSIEPTWEKDSSILIDDGHAWRKYGQKKTMNAKYLRNYYRCTYMKEQGCQAIKQEQRIQDDPPLYRTTYFGHHTCKRSLNSEIIMKPASSFHSSTLLSFKNAFPSEEEQPFSSSVVSSTKQKPMEVIPRDHVTHKQLASSDYLQLLCDYELDFNYSRHVIILSSTEYVEFNSVYGQFLF